MKAVLVPSIIVDPEVELKLIDDAHAEELMELTEKNRAYLKEWLPWVDHMQDAGDFKNYIRRCKHQHEAGTDLGFSIFYKNKLAGRIGIHAIDRQNKSASLGYWLGKEFNGRGLVTRCCQALIRFAFRELSLHRIEIRCATGNHKSAAVAQRLQFRQEAVLKEAEFVNGKFHDLKLFALLKREWLDENEV